MAPAPPLASLYARFDRSGAASPDIAGLSESSLELDKRGIPQPLNLPRDTISPLQAHNALTARAVASTYVPGSGTKPPNAFNNNFFLALFAVIGTGMVIAALWFFFWAKNGGFKFPEDSWDDYKSTVLRRKGPDGKTLSNATKSTKLGYGASTIAGTQHYKWQKQVAKSVVSRDEKGRKGITAKRGWAKTHSILYSNDYQTESFGTETVSDATELRTEPDTNRDGHGHSKRYRDRDVQQYKKEKPARVGGLNRLADGSGFGTTIAGSETMSDASSQPMLPKDHRNKEREQERAERKAREEVARMERRWKKEAEEAAALLARENAPPPPPPAHHTPRKSAAPSAKPGAQKQRRESQSRSQSPKKRDFSYRAGDAASEVLSTAYTGYTGESGVTSTSGTRTASYYDEYRPRASENPRYSSEQRGAAGRSRQSSPKKRESSPKKGAGRKAREGGYRRGADSDLD